MSASVNEFADPPTAYADAVHESGVLYFMDVDSTREYEILSTTAPVSFSVSGPVISLDTTEQLDLLVEVTCEP